MPSQEPLYAGLPTVKYASQFKRSDSPRPPPYAFLKFITELAKLTGLVEHLTVRKGKNSGKTTEREKLPRLGAPPDCSRAEYRIGIDTSQI